MRKSLHLLCLAVCCVLFLTGCGSLPFQNTNELLRAPALGPGEGEIQKALADELKEEPQYKFPKEGNWRSPLVKADLNGDGVDEGILFYSMQSSTLQKERGSNVYMAVLEQKDDAWVVMAEVQGPSIDVASVDVAAMMGDGTQQLIVGYATSNLGNRTLELYQYQGGEVHSQSFGSYYNYLLGDFAGQGRIHLAVVSPSTEQVGNLRLNFLIGQNNHFEMAQEPVDLYQNFASCIGLYPSVDAEGKQLLVMDGSLPSNNIASQILYFSSEGAGFYALPDTAAAMAAKTNRFSPWLAAKDIDHDGMVEIPVETKLAASKDLLLEDAENDEDVPLSQVDWTDVTVTPEVIREFGLLDSDYGLYIRLPEEWRGEVAVKRGAEPGEWRITRQSTGAVLLTMRLVANGTEPPPSAWRVLGGEDLFLIPSRALTLGEMSVIRTVLLS